MIEYVRAELLRRLKLRKASMEYSEKLEQKFSALEEHRAVQRLLFSKRAA